MEKMNKEELITFIQRAKKATFASPTAQPERKEDGD